MLNQSFISKSLFLASAIALLTIVMMACTKDIPELSNSSSDPITQQLKTAPGGVEPLSESRAEPEDCRCFMRVLDVTGILSTDPWYIKDFTYDYINTSYYISGIGDSWYPSETSVDPLPSDFFELDGSPSYGQRSIAIGKNPLNPADPPFESFTVYTEVRCVQTPYTLNGPNLYINTHFDTLVYSQGIPIGDGEANSERWFLPSYDCLRDETPNG